MGKYTKGIEKIPLREIVVSLPIVVFVIDLQNNDNVVDQIDLDYSKPEDKKYLGVLSAWAFTNSHSLEIMSKKDAEAPHVKDNGK